MCEVNDMEFLTLNDDIAVLGISTDGPYSHQQFIDANDLSYPLLTDDDKEIYEQYGLLDTSEGRRQPKRGIIVLDADRTIRYRWEADDNWDDWSMTPVEEAYDVIETLPAMTTS